MAFFDTVKNFFGGIGGSIGQGLLNLGTTAYNIYANERQFKEQQKLNEKAVEMENTATSRALQDAHNAGLSTAQWLSMNGSQFGSPSLSTGGTQMVNVPDVQSPTLKHIEIQRAQNAQVKEEAMLNAQIESINLDNEKKRAEIESTRSGTDVRVKEFNEKVRQFDEEMKYKSSQLSETQRHNLMTESVARISSELNVNEQKRKNFESYMTYGNKTGKPIVLDLGDGYTATIPADFEGLANISSDWDIKRIMSQIDVDNQNIEKSRADAWTKDFWYKFANLLSVRMLGKPLDVALETWNLGISEPDSAVSEMQNTVSNSPAQKGFQYAESVKSNSEYKRKADSVIMLLRKNNKGSIADQLTDCFVQNNKLCFHLNYSDTYVSVPLGDSVQSMYENMLTKF